MPHSPSARRSSFSRAHGSPPHRNEPSQPVFSPRGKAHFAPVGGGATSARGVTALAQTMLPARPGRAYPQPGPTATSPHPGSGVCTAPSADPRRSSERANPRMGAGKHTPWRNPVATPQPPERTRAPPGFTPSATTHPAPHNRLHGNHKPTSASRRRPSSGLYPHFRRDNSSPYIFPQGRICKIVVVVGAGDMWITRRTPPAMGV